MSRHVHSYPKYNLSTKTLVLHGAQLTQKKTALQFKALDQTLQTHDKDGVKQALSYRCADIGRVVPGLMGGCKVDHTHQVLYYIITSEDLVSLSNVLMR